MVTKFSQEFPENPPMWVKTLLRDDTGLGDTVERITTTTGIKNVVEYISQQTGKNCGCRGRKEHLNSKFRYR